MASVLNQLPLSTLSLVGTHGFTAPSLLTSAWGYPDATNNLDPRASKLQYTYSVDGNPNVRIVDYNRWALGGVTTVRPPAYLDELDPNAPNNTQAGTGGVVSQIYKSRVGQRYRDIGPPNGIY
jgi:hypothetical protein